jgi:hypothetical protein
MRNGHLADKRVLWWPHIISQSQRHRPCRVAMAPHRTRSRPAQAPACRGSRPPPAPPQHHLLACLALLSTICSTYPPVWSAAFFLIVGGGVRSCSLDMEHRASKRGRRGGILCRLQGTQLQLPFAHSHPVVLPPKGFVEPGAGRQRARQNPAAGSDSSNSGQQQWQQQLGQRSSSCSTSATGH